MDFRFVLSGLTDYTELIISALAMIMAVFAAIYGYYLSRGHSGRISGWKDKVGGLEQKLAKFDSIFAAYPGLILVWENESGQQSAERSSQKAQAPKVYGSPAAMASMQRFAEPGRPREMAQRILDGLADLETIGEQDEQMTLRELLARLHEQGEAFSVSIILPEGNVLEADGRVAGRQTVLWLEDASIRGEDERTAISRFEAQKLLSSEDPVAFIDMMSRAPFPIFRMAGQERLVWANMAYVAAVQAPSISQVLEQQIYLDDRIAEEVASVLTRQTPLENTRNIIMDGARKSTQVLMFPISGGVVGMALDASENDTLRGALKRHIQAHDELLNNMDEGIVIFGADQRMSFHNTAFADLFDLEDGWFRTGPSHTQWLDRLREYHLLPPISDYAPWKKAEIAYYSHWPDEVPDEIWTLPNDKTLRLVRMRDVSGGMALLFSDITNTVTLQSQFNTLLNVQTATLDKLTEGIAVFGPDGRLRLSNTAFQTLWALPGEAVVPGTDFAALAERCLPLYHDRVFWSELKARTTNPNPEVRRHVDGEIARSDDKMLTWLSRPLPDGATLIAWGDVTSARQAEAALIERAEAVEAADRLKSEFVGHVSYQLRTPLTTISGYADFLQNHGAGELSDKQSEYVFAIQSASEDLRKTIDDILDIAAIEANVLDLELGDVDIFKLLDQALDYVATKAEDTKKDIALDCPADIGVIRADERRIKQVVYNLLSNALRFTKPGGHIVLGARPAANFGVMIWVKDDGVGIPSERQPKVFESFKSSRGGAGLGLALVQRFVERHGGWAELESEEGEGTHVTVYLPRDASVDGAQPELDFQSPDKAV